MSYLVNWQDKEIKKNHKKGNIKQNHIHNADIDINIVENTQYYR